MNGLFEGLANTHFAPSFQESGVCESEINAAVAQSCFEGLDDLHEDKSASDWWWEQ